MEIVLRVRRLKWARQILRQDPRADSIVHRTVVVVAELDLASVLVDAPQYSIVAELLSLAAGKTSWAGRVKIRNPSLSDKEWEERRMWVEEGAEVEKCTYFWSELDPAA